jgi:hypothetical protein
MGEGERFFQRRRLMGRKGRQYGWFDGNRIVEEGRFDDEVIDGAMEASAVKLIGPVMYGCRVCVRVVGCQGMKGDPGRNAERKECQENACKKRSYGTMKVQAVFETLLQITAFSNKTFSALIIYLRKGGIICAREESGFCRNASLHSLEQNPYSFPL